MPCLISNSRNIAVDITTRRNANPYNLGIVGHIKIVPRDALSSAITNLVLCLVTHSRENASVLPKSVGSLFICQLWWDFSWGNMNKCYFISDRAPLIGQKSSSCKYNLVNLWVSFELLTKAWPVYGSNITKMSLHNGRGFLTPALLTTYISSKHGGALCSLCATS